MWRRRKGEEGVVTSRGCIIERESVEFWAFRFRGRGGDTLLDSGIRVDANKSEHRLLFAKSVDTFCAVDGYSG